MRNAAPPSSPCSRKRKLLPGECAALPGPDPFGNGVPIPGSERQTAMQDARRDESGRT